MYLNIPSFGGAWGGFQSLVHPIPNGSTTDAGVGIDDIPVLLQVAHRIAHGVGIFAHHEGLVLHRFRILLQVIGVEVAVVPNGRVAAVAIVERWTGLVELAYLIIHRLYVRAYSTLVAKTPKDDAGVVEVAFDKRLSTVDVGPLETEVLTHHLVGITITVSFVVSLIHHVDAPTVAQFVEVFAVGIMRGAQEVDVGLLHQADVLFVGGIVDVASRPWVMIMTVHATQFYIFAVNLEHFAHNLHLLHAEVIDKFFIVFAILLAKQL